MTIRQRIYDLVPESHFITQDMQVNGEVRPPLAQRDTRRAILYLKRTVIGPLVNRQDNDGDTIRARIEATNGSVDHIRVPARKWKSIEKVRGLQICRAYGLVSANYLYNEVNDTDLLKNPVSVVFGDSAAGAADSAGIPSLAIYEQGLSVQTVAEATERVTHNALSEAGTMWNVGEEKGFRQSLFDTLYVKEGTVFLQSITLEAPTPEALGFVLLTLDATRYGAGKQVLGANVRNEVVGLLATRNEPPVTAYTVLRELGESRSPEKAVEFLLRSAQAWGGHWVDGVKVEELRRAMREDAAGREAMMKDLASAAEAYHRFVYGAQGTKKRAKKTKGSATSGSAEGEAS